MAAAMAVAALLGGLAIQEGLSLRHYEPRLAEQAETIQLLLHQARQAECQAVATSANMGRQLQVAMFGERFAGWGPQLLSRDEAARCTPEITPEPPIEMHWGALEAP